MAMVLRRVVEYSKKYPVLRGMAAYAVLWPSSNLVQQILQGREKIDGWEMARFSLFGSCYVAPTLFLWVKTASRIFPGQSVKVAIKRVLTEQVTYTPMAISGFYAGMTLLEGKSVDEAKEEVKQKFIPTWKVGLLVWPAVQTFNFAFVKERNRVPLTGVVSFFWAVFLSYMKHIEKHRQKLT